MLHVGSGGSFTKRRPLLSKMFWLHAVSAIWSCRREVIAPVLFCAKSLWNLEADGALISCRTPVARHCVTPV